MRQNWYPYVDEPPRIFTEDLGYITAPAGWCAPVEPSGTQFRPQEASFEFTVEKVSPWLWELLTGQPFDQDATDEVDS